MSGGKAVAMSDELRAGDYPDAEDTPMGFYVSPTQQNDMHVVVENNLAEHPADDPQGRSIWEIELDRCRDVMQRVHHLGKVKHIGLREVATALEQLFPPDDGEPITEAFLVEMGFEWKNQYANNDTDKMLYHPRGIRYEVLFWTDTEKTYGFSLGTRFSVKIETLGELRRLLAALKVGRGT